LRTQHLRLAGHGFENVPNFYRILYKVGDGDTSLHGISVLVIYKILYEVVDGDTASMTSSSSPEFDT
jgi:hypothetical protein